VRVGIERRKPLQSAADAILQRPRHGALERGTDIRDVVLAHRLDRPRRLAHRRLQPGKGEIEPRLANERPGKIEPLRVSGPCHAFDRRPAGIRQAQQLGRLVEGLAERVVDGRTPTLVIVHAAHQDELRMAAGDEQHQIGEGEPVRQPRRQRVTLEMVDGIEWLARRAGNRLAGHEPDEEAADQPRPARRGDGIEIAEPAPGAQQRFGDEAIQRLHMGACRDLRHHAAIGAVFLELAQDHFAQDFAPPIRIAHHNGSGGLVAARFDAENGQLRRHEAHGVDCGRL
jgi:hypothetical protein